MKNLTVDFSTLLQVFNRLEVSLFYWRYSGPDGWLMGELEDKDLKAFIAGLYKLTHECLCMQLHVNTPGMPAYVSCTGQWLEKRELIIMTRELIFCCELGTIYPYRELSRNECEIIRYLEIIHAQLIGDYYFQHPGMELVQAHEIRFYLQG